jgi:hypothetical protein
MDQCFSTSLQSRTTSQAVGAHADHLRKIPHTQKYIQMNRIIFIAMVKVTITTFLYTNLN